MNCRSLVAALIVASLAAGCTDAVAPNIGSDSPEAAVLADNLNPEVTPPPADIKISPDLPAVAAPAGIITQAAARDKAVGAMQNRQWGGLLRLTDLRFDAANNMWEAEFQTDGRIPGRPRSHPYVRLSDDPAEQRKLERSWVSVATHLHVAIDGVTGEVRGGGFRGGKVQPDRPDLEHYRGRIVTGGEVLRLRLTRADGSPTGRDIDVWVPQDLLGVGLSLWQLQYGQGRLVEVWGLTGSPGVVLAHRISMADPPPESLLAVPVVAGLPLYPGAIIRPGDDTSTVLESKGADIGTVRDWYA